MSLIFRTNIEFFAIGNAVDEVSERITNGEEFNVRAEYGHRLSPQTLDKLTSKAWRENLPQIRTAFKEAAHEWLGDARNKNAAKEFGYGVLVQT